MTTEEKIRKLLDLASSPNENEAKLAMDKARELMAKYCIQISDTCEEKPQVISEFYVPPIRLSNANFKYCTMIVATLSKHFGVYPLVHGSQLKLYGFPRSITLARYAFDSIFNQLNAAFKLGYSKERSITFTEAFWYGAVDGINRKFTLNTQQCEALVVYDPVKAVIDAMKLYTWNIDCNPMSISGMCQGEAAGSEASIYKGIQHSTNSGRMIA